MRLGDLLRGVPGVRVVASPKDGSGVGSDADGLLQAALALTVGEVRDDSRQVQPGDLFLAVRGTAVDGRAFVNDAAARGAQVVVSDGPVDFPGWVIAVDNAREALGFMAAHRFGAADHLTLAAITGTKGKTTTTYLVESMLRAAGTRPGVMGTVTYRWRRANGQDTVQSAPLTTPSALDLHRMFAEMRDDGVTHVVLEASSQGLDQGRLHGCRFQAAAFTNLSHEHLDYHGTMEAYFDAKAILFEKLMKPGGLAVLPVDREEGRVMAERVRAHGHGIFSVATERGVAADLSVVRANLGPGGIEAELKGPTGPLVFRSNLVGLYNLRNIVLAAGVGLSLGLKPEDVVAGIEGLTGVPGRLERVENPHGILCAVDYAHAPDALEQALAALRPLVAGRLFVVFGCGGDRDRGKRPVMGRLAVRHADLVVVTSDNPRTEDPASILEMILAGVRQEGSPPVADEQLSTAPRGYHAEIDRRRAIEKAVLAAAPGDGILIAGKGHEDYQILGTTKVPFDDRQEAVAAFVRKGAP